MTRILISKGKPPFNHIYEDVNRRDLQKQLAKLKLERKKIKREIKNGKR